MSDRARTLSVVRILTCGAASLVAALSLAAMARHDWPIVLPALLLLGVAALVGAHPSLGAQLFARATWWSNLVLGVVITLIGSGRERRWAVPMALACGLALLVADRRRLAAASERAAYAPAAFRSWLMLLMVFALADAQTFVLFGFVKLRDDLHASAVSLALFAIGAAYVVGFAGLFRLKLWGAVLNLGTSVVAAALIGSGALHVKSDLDSFLTLLSLAHVAVVLPLFVAVAVKWRPPTAPPRLRAFGASAVIVLLMGVATLSYLSRL